MNIYAVVCKIKVLHIVEYIVLTRVRDKDCVKK